MPHSITLSPTCNRFLELKNTNPPLYLELLIKRYGERTSVLTKDQSFGEIAIKDPENNSKVTTLIDESDRTQRSRIEGGAITAFRSKFVH